MSIPPPPAEKEVLDWLFLGKDAHEIAELRGRGYHTIQTEIRNLKIRAGAATDAGLIYAALREGWLEPPERKR